MGEGEGEDEDEGKRVRCAAWQTLVCMRKNALAVIGRIKWIVFAPAISIPMPLTAPPWKGESTFPLSPTMS